MSAPRELDVASLIRNFVDLSLRLHRPGEDASEVTTGTLGATDPISLRFRDARLELVYYTFCVGVWDSGVTTSLSLRGAISVLAYFALLFIVTFIVSTPDGQEFHAFDIQAYGFSFGAIILVDILFWTWYRLIRDSREAAVAASGLGNWSPLKTVISLMNWANVLMCLLVSIIAAIAENSSDVSLPSYGLSLIQRSALFFGIFGRLPSRYAELLVGGTTSMIIYNGVNIYYSNLTWARKANVTATNFVLLVLFAAQQYYGERARRRTFHGSLVAAALRSEVSRLRDTSAALALAQQPSFSVEQVDGPVPAFQCTATMCCVHIHIFANPDVRPAAGGAGIGGNDSTAMFAEVANGDDNFIVHARLLNAVLALADELASRHGVDKVGTHAKQWIGAGGLRDAAALHRSAAALSPPAADRHTKGIFVSALRVVRFVMELQERAPALLADNPDYRGLSVSLSAGVCTERTVVGLLSSEDTEYQCVGDAVTEAHLLATMFHEGTLISECSLRVLESIEPMRKSGPGSESVLAGFVWGSRQPMPSTGRGIVSSCYRNCLRVYKPSNAPSAEAPDSLTLPEVYAHASTPSRPERNSISSSRWAEHVAGADDALGVDGIPPVPVTSCATSSGAIRPTPIEGVPIEIASTNGDSTVVRVVVPSSRYHQRADATISAKSASRWSWSALFSDRGSGDYLDRFLRLRGFSVARSEEVDARTLPLAPSPAPEISASAMQANKRTAAASATAIKLELLTPAPAILATFFAGIFVLEFGGALDIYSDVASLFASPETDASLAIILTLFSVALVRFALLSWRERANVDARRQASRTKVYDRPLLAWKARHADNVFIVVSWTLLVAALTVQNFIREQSRFEFCGRYARSSVWSVAMGSSYILTLLPIRTPLAVIFAVSLNTAWMLSSGIGYSLPPSSAYVPDCPATAPLWPRAVLLYGFLAYMISARLHQDAAIRRMLILQQQLVAGRENLEAQAARLLQVIRRSFPPHVLAICMNIALQEHQRVGSMKEFDVADALLEDHLTDVPTSPPRCFPQLCCATLSETRTQGDAALVSQGEASGTPTVSHRIRGAVVESDVLLQLVPHVAVLCVDLLALKSLSGLLQADDALAVLAFLVSTLDSCVQASEGLRIHVMGSLYVAVFGIPGTTPVAKLNGALLDAAQPLADESHNQGSPGSHSCDADRRFSLSQHAADPEGPHGGASGPSDPLEAHTSAAKGWRLASRPSNAASALLAAATAAGLPTGSPLPILEPLSLPHTVDAVMENGERPLSTVVWQALSAANAIMQRLHSMNEEYGVAMMSAIGIDVGDVRAGILGRRAVSYQVLGAPILTTEKLVINRSPSEIALSSSAFDALSKCLDVAASASGTSSLQARLRGLFDERSSDSPVHDPRNSPKKITEAFFVMRWTEPASLTFHELHSAAEAQATSHRRDEGSGQANRDLPEQSSPPPVANPSSDPHDASGGPSGDASTSSVTSNSTRPPSRVTPDVESLSHHDFKLLRSLGSGQFAQVYLAVHLPSGNPFAVKILDATSVRSRSLQAELRALTTPSRNPFLVEFLCAVHSPGEIWLVQGPWDRRASGSLYPMAFLPNATPAHLHPPTLLPHKTLAHFTEYIDGCTLEAVLDIAVALSERRTRLIVAELACAIGHIHGLGILHRDVKPANVMVQSDGHIRLIDLGLAALVLPPKYAADRASSGSRESSVHSRPVPGSMRSREFSTVSINDRSQPADSTLVALLQSLIPAPRNKVLQRLVDGSGSAAAGGPFLNSMQRYFPAPRAAGALNGIFGSALLCNVHSIDPFGLMASANEAQNDLHSALQLRGLFVTRANTVARTIELLRRDAVRRIFDVVVVAVPSMRMLDSALNLLDEARSLPTAKNGVRGVERSFAVFLEVDGMLFDAAAARLRDAGAAVVGRLPPSVSMLRSICDLASAAAAAKGGAPHQLSPGGSGAAEAVGFSPSPVRASPPEPPRVFSLTIDIPSHAAPSDRQSPSRSPTAAPVNLPLETDPRRRVGSVTAPGQLRQPSPFAPRAPSSTQRTISNEQHQPASLATDPPSPMSRRHGLMLTSRSTSAKPPTLDTSRDASRVAFSSRFPQSQPTLASLTVAGVLQETVATVAGTPAYMASEAIRRRACLASDWFSLGVVAFRCLAGRLPFDGTTREVVHQNVLNNAVRWDCLPAHVSPEARDLLLRLLLPDPAHRIGGEGGAAEVLAHPFFQGWSPATSPALSPPFSKDEREMLALPLLNTSVGVQPSIALSSRYSRIERRLDPSQKQMLRATGRLAASRLASSLGSATQSFMQEEDASAEELARTLPKSDMGSGAEAFRGDQPAGAATGVAPPPPTAPLDLCGASRNVDAISIMTAAMRPRVPDTGVLGGRHVGGVHAPSRLRSRDGDNEGSTSAEALSSGQGASAPPSPTRESLPMRVSPSRLSETHGAAAAASGALAAATTALPPRSAAAAAPPAPQRNSSVVIGVRSTAAPAQSSRGSMGGGRSRLEAPAPPLDAHSDDESSWGGGDTPPLVVRPLLRSRFLSRISERVSRVGSELVGGEDDDATGASVSEVSSDGDAGSSASVATGAAPPRPPLTVPRASPLAFSPRVPPAAPAPSALPVLSSVASRSSGGSSVDSWEEDERRVLAELASSRA